MSPRGVARQQRRCRRRRRRRPKQQQQRPPPPPQQCWHQQHDSGGDGADNLSTMQQQRYLRYLFQADRLGLPVLDGIQKLQAAEGRSRQKCRVSRAAQAAGTELTAQTSQAASLGATAAPPHRRLPCRVSQPRRCTNPPHVSHAVLQHAHLVHRSEQSSVHNVHAALAVAVAECLAGRRAVQVRHLAGACSSGRDVPGMRGSKRGQQQADGRGTCRREATVPRPWDKARETGCGDCSVAAMRWLQARQSSGHARQSCQLHVRG